MAKMIKKTRLPSVKDVLDSLDSAVSETAAATKKVAAKKTVKATKKAAAKAPVKKAAAKKAPAKKAAKAPAKKTVAKKAIADMTLAELKAEAKARGLTGYSSKAKAELVKMLSAKSETTIKAAKPRKSVKKKAGGEIVEEDTDMKVNTLGPSVAQGDGPAVPRDASPEVEIEFLLSHLDAPDAVAAMKEKFKTGTKLPDLKPMEMLSQWIARAIKARESAGALLTAARAVSREKASPSDVQNRLRGFKRADLVRLASKHGIKVAPSAKVEVALKALLDAVAKGDEEFRKGVLADIVAGAGELKPIPVTQGAKARMDEPRLSYTSKPAKKGFNWSVKDGHGKVISGPYKTEKAALAAMDKLKASAPAKAEAPVSTEAPAGAELTKAPPSALVVECRRVGNELEKAISFVMRSWNDSDADIGAKRAQVAALNDRLSQVNTWAERLSGDAAGGKNEDNIKEGLEEFSAMAKTVIDAHQRVDKATVKATTPKGAKYPSDAKGLTAYLKVRGEVIREETRKMSDGSMSAGDAANIVAEAKALMNHVRAAAKGSTEISDYIVRVAEALHEGAEYAFSTGKFKPDSKGKPEKDGHGKAIWYPEDKPYIVTAHWRPVSNKTISATFESLHEADAKVKELLVMKPRKPQGISIDKAVRKPGPKKDWPYGWNRLPVKRIARDGKETIPKNAVV